MTTYRLLDDEPAKPSGKNKFRLLEDAPDPTGTFTENLAAGAGKAIVDLGRGAKQILDVPAQFLERTFGTFRPMGMPSATESAKATESKIRESREFDKPLMDTVGGVIGNIGGNVISTLAMPGAGTYKGAIAAGGVLAGLQPTLDDESPLSNAALGAAAGAAGKYAGDKIAGGLSRLLAGRKAAATALAVQNTARDTSLDASRAAGYVVPPRMVQEHGTGGKIMEALGGKIKTEQLASNKNQVVTNALARKALGVADDTPITPDILKGIRSQAGEAYEALRGAGTITADRQFSTDLSKIMQKYQGASKDFPELAKNEIGDIVESISKPQFSADSAIDAISILRDKAAAAFAKGDKGIGSAYRQTSQALEDAIERNLIERGSQETIKAFQAARRVIAKTYSVEKALESGGNISAQKLASQLKKGKPLTDELKLIGEFAGNFPKAAQTVAKVEPVSVLDLFSVGGLGAMGAGPASVIPLMRPAARATVLSQPYQRMMATPDYSVSPLLRGAARGSESIRRLLPGIASTGTIGNVEQ